MLAAVTTGETANVDILNIGRVVRCGGVSVFPPIRAISKCRTLAASRPAIKRRERAHRRTQPRIAKDIASVFLHGFNIFFLI